MLVLDLGLLATFHDAAPAAKILAQSRQARLVLFGFRKGQALDEHSTSSSLTAQAISGKVQFHTQDESVILLPGELLILPPNTVHKIVALEESTVLAYLMPNPEAHTLQKEVFDKLTPMIEI
ncbi:MAG TPA: cupin domain-containing protein [Anaerolineae bacterium]|jgi:quercetin dioxygenase-like cupin family protein|nr:cupin domain-containing protein [Anaerolineae bacterium]